MSRNIIKMKQARFNQEQIALVVEAQNEFKRVPKNPDSIDYWEREQWYRFNRSGLFEDDRSNKTGITDWTQSHTREYITEN